MTAQEFEIEFLRYLLGESSEIFFEEIGSGVYQYQVNIVDPDEEFILFDITRPGFLGLKSLFVEWNDTAYMQSDRLYRDLCLSRMDKSVKLLIMYASSIDVSSLSEEWKDLIKQSVNFL